MFYFIFFVCEMFIAANASWIFEYLFSELYFTYVAKFLMDKANRQWKGNQKKQLLETTTAMQTKLMPQKEGRQRRPQETTFFMRYCVPTAFEPVRASRLFEQFMYFSGAGERGEERRKRKAGGFFKRLWIWLDLRCVDSFAI